MIVSKISFGSIFDPKKTSRRHTEKRLNNQENSIKKPQTDQIASAHQKTKDDDISAFYKGVYQEIMDYTNDTGAAIIDGINSLGTTPQEIKDCNALFSKIAKYTKIAQQKAKEHGYDGACYAGKTDNEVIYNPYYNDGLHDDIPHEAITIDIKSKKAKFVRA